MKTKNLVFDIGANLGNATEFLLRYSNKVICFEPNPELAKMLRIRFLGQNVFVDARGVSDRIEVKQFFLSNAHTISTFDKAWISQSRFSNEFKWDQSIDVQTTTLDSLISEYGVPDFVKIDVEGHELSVLTGLSKLLENTTFGFEWTEERYDDIIKIFRHIESLGYNDFSFSYEDKLTFGEELDWGKWQSLKLHQDINVERKSRWGMIYFKRKADKTDLHEQSETKNFLNIFANNIVENKNFSFVKIGDGEIDAMICREGTNCDGHSYTIELSKKLKISFIELCNKDIYLADWFKSNPPQTPRDLYNFQFLRRYIKENKISPNLISPFELFLPGWGNLCDKNLLKFFQKVKETGRKKIYVGPRVLEKVNSLLNINHFVEIPKINAFAEHERILNDIKSIIEDNCIVILTVGLMSPYLANEILNLNPNVTILDVGSGFDPLFIGQTRGGGQASPERVIEYYSELLDFEHKNYKTYFF